jgi:Leucine-rich repeat (LRR) protein
MCVVQLSMRENDLVEVPRELGQLQRLRELHLQGNRLVVLPPEIGQLKIYFIFHKKEFIFLCLTT